MDWSDSENLQILKFKLGYYVLEKPSQYENGPCKLGSFVTLY